MIPVGLMNNVKEREDMSNESIENISLEMNNVKERQDIRNKSIENISLEMMQPSWKEMSFGPWGLFVRVRNEIVEGRNKEYWRLYGNQCWINFNIDQS